MFAKLIKNIEVAARTGGGDPDGNPTLFDAIQKAKKSSVPNDNIDRAVKRGSGADAGGADYQTITYEGYGPNGVAVLVECLTDNRNRAATEVRLAMTRNGGTMADPGSVAYLFNRKGVVIVPEGRPHRGRRAARRARRRRRGGQRPRRQLRGRLRGHRPHRRPHRPAATPGSTTTPPDPTFLPSMQVPLDAEGANKVFRLIDALEDSDEVQNVYANFDVSRRGDGRGRRVRSRVPDSRTPVLAERPVRSTPDDVAHLCAQRARASAPMPAVARRPLVNMSTRGPSPTLPRVCPAPGRGRGGRPVARPPADVDRRRSRGRSRSSPRPWQGGASRTLRSSADR